MKTLALLSFFVVGVAYANPLRFYPQGLVGANEPFIAHAGPGEYDSYLSLNLPFSPAEELRLDVERLTSWGLMHRGEAHVTVVTPVEFWNVLKPQGMTIQEIDQIAMNSGLQQSQLEAVCLGRGQLEINGILESTYYVVVKSQDLVALRKRIQERFEALGGTVGAFNAEAFYPHITLGYTARDLHESDGIIKNEESCFEELEIR